MPPAHRQRAGADRDMDLARRRREVVGGVWDPPAVAVADVAAGELGSKLGSASCTTLALP